MKRQLDFLLVLPLLLALLFSSCERIKDIDVSGTVYDRYTNLPVDGTRNPAVKVVLFIDRPAGLLGGSVPYAVREVEVDSNGHYHLFFPDAKGNGYFIRALSDIEDYYESPSYSNHRVEIGKNTTTADLTTRQVASFAIHYRIGNLNESLNQQVSLVNPGYCFYNSFPPRLVPYVPLVNGMDTIVNGYQGEANTPLQFTYMTSDITNHDPVYHNGPIVTLSVTDSNTVEFNY